MTRDTWNEKRLLDEQRLARNLEIFRRYNDGATTAQLAEEFGVSRPQVNYILRSIRGKTTEQGNICFDCAHACGGCSWSARFEPVPGWTAEPVKIRYYNTHEGPKFTRTYRITACPQFERG
jgi:hypothetical protein